MNWNNDLAWFGYLNRASSPNMVITNGLWSALKGPSVQPIDVWHRTTAKWGKSLANSAGKNFLFWRQPRKKERVLKSRWHSILLFKYSEAVLEHFQSSSYPEGTFTEAGAHGRNLADCHKIYSQCQVDWGQKGSMKEILTFFFFFFFFFSFFW